MNELVTMLRLAKSGCDTSKPRVQDRDPDACHVGGAGRRENGPQAPGECALVSLRHWLRH